MSNISIKNVDKKITFKYFKNENKGLRNEKLGNLKILENFSDIF